MKKLIYIIPTLFLFHATAGCNSDKGITPDPDKPSIDMSTTCRSVQESGSYQTFYKPQHGDVGDPMPYYNAEENRFYLFYLYENANKHPIHLRRTVDYGTFQGFMEILPAGQSGSQDEWIGTGSFIKKDNT